MPATLDQIRDFWTNILEDEEAKLADRMKAAENLAKLLDPRDAEKQDAPDRLVVVYR
ncbi:MAG: hypothetical protein VB111_05545 [Clostridiaceae bacterium]|nr:hypothetical protein [Clostridiaceae bacterium]